MTILLEIKDVIKRFGGIVALNNVSLCVNEKEIVGLIGPNGSGKTTLINVISGLYKPDSGKIIFKGVDISKIPAYLRCRMGISRTYQITRLFGRLTALENVVVSVLNSERHGKISVAQAKHVANDILMTLGLEKIKNTYAKLLTAPQRRLLEIARAVGGNPELLLLDECVTGLTPSETLEVLDAIKKISREREISIIMVEHVMHAVMSVSDRVIVLHEGKKIAEGSPKEIAESEKVAEVYFGDREIALGFLREM
ncbi:MAG: ABC transporter ATP-binding protein [Candidatus Bathyarchaeia archaeon]